MKDKKRGSVPWYCSLISDISLPVLKHSGSVGLDVRSGVKCRSGDRPEVNWFTSPTTISSPAVFPTTIQPIGQVQELIAVVNSVSDSGKSLVHEVRTKVDW